MWSPSPPSWLLFGLVPPSSLLFFPFVVCAFFLDGVLRENLPLLTTISPSLSVEGRGMPLFRGVEELFPFFSRFFPYRWRARTFLPLFTDIYKDFSFLFFIIFPPSSLGREFFLFTAGTDRTPQSGPLFFFSPSPFQSCFFFLKAHIPPLRMEAVLFFFSYGIPFLLFFSPGFNVPPFFADPFFLKIFFSFPPFGVHFSQITFFFPLDFLERSAPSLFPQGSPF